MTARTAHGPLVVAEFTTTCDRGPSGTVEGHEVTVITDGSRVSANGNDQQFTSAVYRHDTRFTVSCDVLDRHDEPCDGSVTVDTADHGCWRAATEADHLALRTGQQVDQ